MTAVIRIFVFVSGAILMALEMLASRFLAPQYGNSIIVWASVIGVFLAGLAAGYSLGGRFADRFPKMSGVAIVLMIGGAVVLLIPIAAPLVFAIAPSTPRAGSLTATILLFLAPTLLLGSVSPYAIRLDAADRDRLGRSAGNLYAISTAGSIAGTIVTAFWLIPLAGVDALTYMLGGALLLEAAAIAIYAGARERVLRLVLATAAGTTLVIGGGIFAVQLAEAHRPIARDANRILFQHDSFYHHIVVSESADTRSLRFDNWTQSAISLADPMQSRAAYTDYFHLGAALAGEPHDVLFIGLGGGTIVRQFLRDYPKARVDVAEIDADVPAVAQRFFYFPPADPRVRVFIEDGRRYLERSDRMYDLIVIDAFNRDIVPFHLVTKEFFALCNAKLNRGGYVAMNVIGSSDGRASAAVASVFQTAASVFREHYLFARFEARARHIAMTRNCILVAGNGEAMPDAQLFATIAAASHVRSEYRRLASDLVAGGPETTRAKILTDKFAPIEEMMR